MTREEHLDWCKERAHKYLARGDLRNAVTSMMSNLTKHDETASLVRGEMGILGLAALMSNEADFVRRYIDGFH